MDAVTLGVGVGLVSGLIVPRIIAVVPEPEPPVLPVPTDGPASAVEEDRLRLPPAPAKELYADIAHRRGLGLTSAVAGAIIGGLLGSTFGWSWSLVVWLPLVPIGIALAVIDWRTTLLPTRIIAPSYGLVIILTVAVAAAEHDWGVLAMAGWGWLVMGGGFFLLWFIYPRGLGYGDVRLSGVLGLMLGPLGWSVLLVGMWAGFLLGGLGGVLLSALRMADRTRYPFGPFMLLGAVLGILVGPATARLLGY